MTMGHERIGALPKSQEWRDLVAQIAATAEAPETVVAVATTTLHKVRARFDRIHEDPGFQAAFGFILGLSAPSLGNRSADFVPEINLSRDPSPIRLAAEMGSWVDLHADSREYAELGKRAAADVITFWTRRSEKQGDLFGGERAAVRIWAGARNGGAFSELCRVFFGKFTEHYLKYFLDREASAKLPTVEARERFAASLEQHIDDVARHSFETTHIAQSFAAGWYNKHAQREPPTDKTVLSFLAFAMGKLRQELLRESAAS